MANNINKTLGNIGFFAFVLVVVLFFTNPEMRDFEEHFKQEMIDKAYEEHTLAGTLADLFDKPLWELLEPNVSRQNYLLLSIYIVDLGEEKFTYLGLVDNFIRLN